MFMGAGGFFFGYQVIISNFKFVFNQDSSKTFYKLEWQYKYRDSNAQAIKTRITYNPVHAATEVIYFIKIYNQILYLLSLYESQAHKLVIAVYG